MPDRYKIQVSSRLTAPPAAIWAFVRTLSGINHELFPFARMTHPGLAAAFALDLAPLNRQHRHRRLMQRFGGERIQ